MKMKYFVLSLTLLGLLSLAGCKNTVETPAADATDTTLENPVLDAPVIEEPDAEELISFSDHHLYAVAYLGYEEMNDPGYYQENYGLPEDVPFHFFSGGEYYLIIPRYDDMKLCLYQNDMETMDKTLIYKTADTGPFIVQCNISDIFSDVTVELSRQGETVEFSPYISLKDGSVVVGDRGLDITQAR